MSGWLSTPTEAQRATTQVVLTLVLTLAGGYYVNRLTEAASGSVADVLADLGWDNVALGLAVLALLLQVFLPLRWRKAALAAHAPLVAPTLKQLLAIAITAFRAAKPGVRLNGRYFEHTREDGRELLRRIDAVHVETEEMPDEFALDAVDLALDADTVVICRSFSERRPLYVALDDDLRARYRPEIANAIDPRQTWVLACPVIPRGGGGQRAPLGVICFYGSAVPVTQAGDEAALKQMATTLATGFAAILDGYERLDPLGAGA